MSRLPLGHIFFPSHDGTDRCGFMLAGATWTASDAIYCRQPRQKHEPIKRTLREWFWKWIYD